MAPSVKHTFVSPIPDGGDPTIVGPNAWNDAHTLVGVQGTIALTTTGTSGASTFDGTTLNVPVYAFADTGITQLTADVLAGPGNGSQAATVVALNGTNLASLATGFLVNTTGTGVPTIKTAPTSLVVGTSDTQTLTNKNLAGAGNVFPTFNQNTTGSAAKWTTARLLAGNSVDGSANVAFANKFIVQGTTDTGLSAAQFLGALGTGIVKNTTTTGVLSIATGADLPVMTATVGGAVPTPPNNTTTFLRGDGTFATPAGSGTVTSVSVVSANGLAGTVATSTSTPAITLSTSVTGIAKGNGTSLSAATAGTDYVAPGGALGTPSSGVATNLTGTAAGLTAGAATAANGLNSATTTVAVSAATAPTTGQVLTATSGTAATWQTPSGGQTLLSTGSPTAAATYTVTGLPTTYNQFLIVVQAVLSGNVVMRVAVSSDNGSTFDTPMTLSSGTSQNSAATIYSVSATAVKLMLGVNGAGAAIGALSSVKTAPTNALQFSLNSGNFSGGGTVLIYGVK